MVLSISEESNRSIKSITRNYCSKYDRSDAHISGQKPTSLARSRSSGLIQIFNQKYRELAENVCDISRSSHENGKSCQI